MKPATPSIAELLRQRQAIAERLAFLETELSANPGPVAAAILSSPIRQRRRQLEALDMEINRMRQP
jgi:ubiquinone biosynthesis protein UbiJ